MVANTTYFLDQPVAEHIGTHLVKAEKKVDFSKKNVVIDDTASLMTVPAGAIIITAGFHTITHEDSVTFTMGTEATTYANLLAATAIGADASGAIMQNQDSSMVYCPTETTIRTIVAGANATACVVTFWVIYAIVNAKS
jgi:hypothetical protein